MCHEEDCEANMNQQLVISGAVEQLTHWCSVPRHICIQMFFNFSY